MDHTSTTSLFPFGMSQRIFPKDIRVTTIDARTRAVDFVSRKTYSSRYYKTVVPRSATTKHPPSSCRSNPLRGRILQHNVCDLKSRLSNSVVLTKS